jgi:hypothetical protein
MLGEQFGEIKRKITGHRLCQILVKNKKERKPY